MDDTDQETTDELHLEIPPSLPQSRTIRSTALQLWQDQRVRAIWLGGSLASGMGDPYSDIDLRIAVAPSDVAAWESPDFAALLESPVLGKHLIRLSKTTFLHHLVLGNGDILDFLVQSSDAAAGDEPVLILACRDAEFAEKLRATDHLPESTETPATGEAIREQLIAFWINSHKHRKVLYRNLDLMFTAGAYANWAMLMRLWYIAATGYDTSPRHFSGIHGLTELVRAIEGVFGNEPREVFGMPTRTREEICDLIERDRDVAARLGRQLAARYDFGYPEAMEAMVREAWAEFRARTNPPESEGRA